MYYSLLCFMVHLKRKKSSFILHFKCLYLYGFWRYPFHFIDLSAQNAINQYHFIKQTVSGVFNRVLFRQWRDYKLKIKTIKQQSVIKKKNNNNNNNN